ncbi:YrzQ family protein [Litchfieldia salsa]
MLKKTEALVCNLQLGVKSMNKMFTSLVTIGLGAAAYNMAQRNNLMNGRKMKKMRKRISKAIS